jgi:hypothetical protein
MTLRRHSGQFCDICQFRLGPKSIINHQDLHPGCRQSTPRKLRIKASLAADDTEAFAILDSRASHEHHTMATQRRVLSETPTEKDLAPKDGPSDIRPAVPT